MTGQAFFGLTVLADGQRYGTASSVRLALD
jgi:hypothetical protein